MLSGILPEVNVALKYRLPEDCCYDFSEEAVSWLQKYGIGVDDAIRSHMVYSPANSQLIFKFYGADGELILWQARNFNPSRASKSKYFTSGDHSDILPIYGGDKDGVVVVEDCVSALRIGSQLASMPLLGSHLATQKLTRLNRLYSNLWVWLDSDKFKEAQEIARRASMLGINAKVVFSELDPKCYTNEQIKGYLK